MLLVINNPDLCYLLIIWGRSAFAKQTTPRPLRANMVSKSLSDNRSTGPSDAVPAFKQTTPRSRSASSRCTNSLQASIVLIQEISALTALNSVLGWLWRSSAIFCSIFSKLRETIQTLKPSPASWLLSSRPMPSDPPVTTAQDAPSFLPYFLYKSCLHRQQSVITLYRNVKTKLSSQIEPIIDTVHTKRQKCTFPSASSVPHRRPPKIILK